MKWYLMICRDCVKKWKKYIKSSEIGTRLVHVLIWVPAIINGILGKSNILYYVTFLGLMSFILRKGITFSKLICLSLYSLVLPSDYLIVGLIFICIIYYFIILRRVRIHIFLIVGAILVVISNIVNESRYINILFSLLYSLPFYFFVNLSLLNEKYDEAINRQELDIVIWDIYLIEVLATGVQLVRGISIQEFGYDWCVGTLGEGKAGSLAIIMSLGVLYLVAVKNNINQSQKAILFTIGVFIVMCTSSYALSGCILIAITLPILIAIIRKPTKKIIKVLMLMLILSGVMWSAIPDVWQEQIVAIAKDKEYREDRFYKLEFYKDTFVSIPQNDIKFLLLGAGQGQYSSRAAATCTGTYIDAYEDVLNLSPSVGDYAKVRIYPYLLELYNKEEHGFRRETENRARDLGSCLSYPFSSVITTMGEHGIIFLLLVGLTFYYLIKEKGIAAQIALLILVMCCVLDNYLEMAKIVIFAFAIYWAVSERKMKDKVC